MMRTIFLLILFLISMPGGASQTSAESYRPKEGYVSSEATAKIIAEAVLVPIYGGSEIRRQKPFKIARKGRTWIVEGSTPADRGVPYLGGNFTIHIDSVSGAITHLSHSK